MKVSVIIPSYKPGEYIWECLGSLRRQTLSPDQFEILIVLNGCNQPYFSQIEEYVQEHGMKNVRLMQTDTPGVSNARNLALEHATGQYVTFVDDDDYVSDTYLKGMLDVAGEGITPVSNVIAFDDETGSTVPNYITNRYAKIAGKGPVSLFCAKSYMSVPVAKILRMDMIGSHRFNTHFDVGEDILFMFEISRYMHRMAASDPGAVYYRRVRPVSASMRHRSKSEWLSMIFRSIAAYTRVYIAGFPHYNLPLYLSRVAAKLRQAVRLI